jgi:hypothetical protein
MCGLHEVPDCKKILASDHEFVVMDNARIHSLGNATVIEDMLWETTIDGHPLHIFVVYLPTCSPELNLMELVLHILAFQVLLFLLPDCWSLKQGCTPAQGLTGHE